MDRYDKAELIKLLDADTLVALLKIYGITYKHLAIRLNVTRPAISYHVKNNSFKSHDLRIVLDLLFNHGLEVAELILINKMVNTARKVKRSNAN